MKSQIVIDFKNYAEYSYIIPYIRYCAEDKYNSFWELPNRKIGDFEFILITKGSGRFIIAGQEYNVKPNDLLLFKPAVPHSGVSVDLPFEFLCAHFDLFIAKEKSQFPAKPIKYISAMLDFPVCMHIGDAYFCPFQENTQ